jgi:lipopolysaccharide export system protein LptA
VQKIFVILFLLISPVLLFGQQKSIIKIISSESLTGDIKKKVSYLRKPVFQQDNATLTCDSAVLYTERNYFEAYNNVHITQLTTDIYSDQLQYDGNKKHAHLTGNVKMIDPQSTLTTNILDYNLASKIGTYTSGGKIVTQDVTLTSKNGYYFSNSYDAYFRYNVVVVTPQSLIKSDTMRYNTQSKWTYFYGPTNIKGKDDNLYTENGAYNTLSEDAYFGKKNLYTQNTKSLKGDSLYYYGKAGYGKAVKNIVFMDKKDGTKMFGDLGYYYKIDQRTLVTRNAYVSIVTNDSITVNNKKQPDSIRIGADTLETQMVLQKTLKLIPKISVKADNQIEEDEEKPAKADKREDKQIATEEKTKAPPARLTAKERKKGNQKLLAKNDSTLLKPFKDSLNVQTDSLSKIIPKPKIDSLIKLTTKPKIDSLAKNLVTLKKDSALKIPIKKGLRDTLNKTIANLKPANLLPDTGKINPADTVQTRIIKAYHGAKVFKSNIQAKTDSLFYTNADSTLRCFGNPIIWSEGSQQIGDTIYVQMKNNKLNNLQAFKNAFLVNTPKDSLRFNQIKGRYMTGFFTDGKLNNMFVDGNAESIYYTQDDSTKVYKEMNQTLSSRIKFIFKDNDVKDILYISGVEGALNPENKVSKDNVLKGFSWKPKERPKSKKDAIGSSGKAKPKAKPKTVITKSATNKAADSKVVTPKISPQGKPALVKPDVKPDTSNFGIKPILPKQDTLNQVKKIAIKQ